MPNVVDVGTPPSGFHSQETSLIRFHGFAALPTTRGLVILSPGFTCFGRQWCLSLYPGGKDISASGDGRVSVFLHLLSNETLNICCGFTVKDVADQTVARAVRNSKILFSPDKGWGYTEFVKRSKLTNALVRGALVIEVRLVLMEKKFLSSAPFIPKNPFHGIMLKIFMDEESADVVFKVADGDQQVRKTRSSLNGSHVKFYAHRLILQKCAPALAEMCGSGRDVAQVPITDVKPEIFHHLMHYIYGGKVSNNDLKAHFKDIIDAAVRFDVVNLKMEAEVWYVKMTTIEVDTVMEHLHYAVSKNCALLKEAVMDFIVVNGVEVLEMGDMPGGKTLFADLLVAMSSRNKKSVAGDQFSTMRVSDLRENLEKGGLDVDGSRETMIAALRDNA